MYFSVFFLSRLLVWSLRGTPCFIIALCDASTR
jgi:hypothetical protein